MTLGMLNCYKMLAKSTNVTFQRITLSLLRTNAHMVIQLCFKTVARRQSKHRQVKTPTDPGTNKGEWSAGRLAFKVCRGSSVRLDYLRHIDSEFIKQPTGAQSWGLQRLVTGEVILLIAKLEVTLCWASRSALDWTNPAPCRESDALSVI